MTIQPGYVVETKAAPKKTGRVKGAVLGKRHTWKVKFVDEEGESYYEELKSQQVTIISKHPLPSSLSPEKKLNQDMHKKLSPRFLRTRKAKQKRETSSASFDTESKENEKEDSSWQDGDDNDDGEYSDVSKTDSRSIPKKSSAQACSKAKVNRRGDGLFRDRTRMDDDDDDDENQFHPNSTKRKASKKRKGVSVHAKNPIDEESFLDEDKDDSFEAESRSMSILASTSKKAGTRASRKKKGPSKSSKAKEPSGDGLFWDEGGDDDDHYEPKPSKSKVKRALKQLSPIKRQPRASKPAPKKKKKKATRKTKKIQDLPDVFDDDEYDSELAAFEEDEVSEEPPLTNGFSSDSDSDSDDDSFYSGDEDHITEDPKGDFVQNLEPKHRLRWKKKRYERDLAALKKAKWTVDKTAADDKKIRVGVIVKTRKKPHYQGEVISEVDKNVWRVRLTIGRQTQESILKSTQLKVCDDSQAVDAVYTWRIVDDVVPEAESISKEYDDIGLIGFDFHKFDFERVSTDNPQYEFPYLELLQYLWPGDWRSQLRQMNKAIREHNKKVSRGKVKELSEHDWWVFIGIVIAAAPEGKGGEKLFDNGNGSSRKKHRTFSKPTNVGRGPGGRNIMAQHRFNDIKKFFPTAFYDHDAKENGDPWYCVGLLVDGLNKNRKKVIAASNKKIFDETMSALKPRTTITGMLPNLSFILRKPKPLGTELKVSMCSVIGKF